MFNHVRKLLAIAILSLCATLQAQEKLYVNPDNISFISDSWSDSVPVVKQFHLLGIPHIVKQDKHGFFIVHDKEHPIAKGRFEYHYCAKCDQEFFTRRKFRDHVCKKGYYERHDGGSRICDASEFRRPSEFNRPSEFFRF